MQIKVASYNIRKAVGRDRRRDPARVLQILNELNADIVVLQEADRRLGARPSAIPRSLLDRETDYYAADLARNDVSLGWHGNAVLVRRGLELDAVDHIELPGLEPRGAVRVQLGPLSVVGTHLGLLRLWRHRQMTAISRHIGGDSATTVIAGDFNEWSDIRGFEPWEAEFSITYPGRSFPTIRPIASLDGIACGSAITIQDHGVVRSSSATIASDHFPIWANLTVEPPP